MRKRRQASPHAARPFALRSAAGLAIAAGLCAPASAAWNPGIGYKDDNDAAVQVAFYSNTNRLYVVGGSLTFQNGVQITGDYVLLQPEAGWTAPQVFANNGLTFEVNSFKALNGAFLLMPSPGSAGAITTPDLEIGGGAIVSIRQAFVSASARLHGANSALNLQEFHQTAGDLELSGQCSLNWFAVLNFTGDEFHALSNATIAATFPAVATGLVDAGEVKVGDGSHATVRNMVSDSTQVFGMNSLLHVLGDYTQDQGDFAVTGLGSFQTDGAFQFAGGVFVLNSGLFSVGDPAASAIHAAAIYMDGGPAPALTVGTLSSEGDVQVNGGSLHVLGDYTQTGGIFDLVATNLQVDGAFNFTGASFSIVFGGLHTVGNAIDSTVDAGSIQLDSGTQLTIGNVVARGAVNLHDKGEILHVLDDFDQSAGNFSVVGGAELTIDHDFSHAGGAPAALVVGADSLMRVGGDLELGAGATLDVGGTVHVGEGPNGAAGTLRVGPDGTIRGNGVINCPVLAESGFVSPGLTEGALAGVLGVNNSYTQGADATFDVEILSPAAADADRLTVAGQASLAGELNIVVLSRFEPQWGDHWTVMTYAGRSGDFTDFHAPALGPGQFWWRDAGETTYALGVRLGADTDHNGAVDFIDLNNVLSFYGTSGAGSFGRPFSSGDTNEDGVVDFTDLNNVLSFFGQSAPPAP